MCLFEKGNVELNQSEILREVQNIFREVFDNTELVVTRETTANDIEPWDSLNHMVLVVAIEKHFDVKFGLAALQSFEKVGNMIDLIEEKIQ